MDAANPFASLFPPLQSGATASTSTSTTTKEDVLDWSALFAQPTAIPPSNNLNSHPNFTSALFAASPEGLSAGSPASSRDFGSPMLDFELPFAAENEAALFPPEQPSEVADWMAKFNLANSHAQPQGQTNTAPQWQIDMANALRAAAQLTAQQHSSSQQSASTATDSAFSQSMSIPGTSSSQQQDRAFAQALGNATADLPASQHSMISNTSSEDDFIPIQAPVRLPTSMSVSPNTAQTVPDFLDQLNSMQTSWYNPPVSSMADSTGGLSQQSSTTIGGSQLSSRGGSPTPSESPRGAVNSLATVFVREYARSHPVHDTDVLVRGLRLAGIEISDTVLREIVGPSPLSLGSPASHFGQSSASVSPQLGKVSPTTMSAVNCNANFAMLMSGLGMAGQTQTDSELHNFSQSSSISSLSSVPDVMNLPVATNYEQQLSQSSMAQSQSDDGWSSDASCWSPPPPSGQVPRKVKVTQPAPSSSRVRSSLSVQRSDAKTDILGSTNATTSINSYLPGGSSSDGIMTTIWLPSGKRAFSCNVCHKHFDRAFNLRTHADTHKTVEEREKGKRFVCPHNHGESDECGKPFARKHDCIRHWKTVHGKAMAGSSSAAAINKLKVPQPIVKDSDREASSSSGDEDGSSDDDDGDHTAGYNEREVSASTGRSSFG
ncbi:hypothetical protein CF319_g6392 [Tilletia indica]|nr:hypothetical protein CF319_g6392 [Tilletia indica]